MDKLVIRVAEQNLTKIKELINQGYDLNKPYNEHGWTPFTLAVAHPHVLTNMTPSKSRVCHSTTLA